MLVFFAVFLFLIQNSFDLMATIYEVVKLAIDRVVDLFGTGMPLDLSAVSITTTDDDAAASSRCSWWRSCPGSSSSWPTWSRSS